METVTKIQENAEDIYAEAKQINQDREESEKSAEIESTDPVEETDNNEN